MGRSIPVSEQVTANVAATGDYFLNKAAAERRHAEMTARYANHPEMLAQFDKELEQEMSKGVAAIGLGDIGPSIPQDLDQTYRSLDAKNEGYGLNMILRAVPKIQGFARTHEYVLQTSTGLGGTAGRANEYAVGNFLRPVQQKLTSSPKWLKLMYMRSRSADDVRSIGDFSEPQTRLNLRRIMNSELIWADTRAQLNGANGLGQRGIIELIQSGTNGVDGLGTDAYNYGANSGAPLGHTWDWKGQGPSLELVRQAPRELFHMWGNANNLAFFMPNRAIAGIEALQDANRRANNAFDFAFNGQAVSGILVNGNLIPYIPDSDLSPFSRDNLRGFYNTRRPEGAPTTAPVCTPVLQNEGTTDSITYGLWDSNPYGGNSANSVRYVVTFFDDNDMESLGTLTGATLVTGNGTKEMKLTITGIPANATRGRVYRFDTNYGTLRGISSPAATDACWIMDFAPPGDGSSVVVIDHNVKRPYCGTGIVMGVQSAAMPYLTSRERFEQAVRENGFEGIMPFVSEDVLSHWVDNSIREVYVGPTMFTNLLANTMDTRLHYMIGCWRSAEMTNPFLGAVINNIPLQ